MKWGGIMGEEGAVIGSGMRRVHEACADISSILNSASN